MTRKIFLVANRESYIPGARAGCPPSQDQPKHSDNSRYLPRMSFLFSGPVGGRFFYLNKDQEGVRWDGPEEERNSLRQKQEVFFRWSCSPVQNVIIS